MIVKKVGPRWLCQADDLLDLERGLAALPKQWHANASETENPNHKWTLNHTMSDVRAMMRTGWHDGVVTLAGLRAAPVETASAGKDRFDVFGERPDVGRFCAGEPAHMVRRGREQKKQPIVTIAVNIRIAAGITADEQMNFGAAMVTLVDQLERSGRRVELLVLGACNVNFDGTEHKGRWAISWTVKRAEDVLDLSAIAFSLAHPGAYRRVCFAAMERSPKSMETAWYGSGGGISREDFIDIADDALLIEGISFSSGECKTPEGATRFAVERINKAAGFALVEKE